METDQNAEFNLVQAVDSSAFLESNIHISATSRTKEGTKETGERVKFH